MVYSPNPVIVGKILSLPVARGAGVRGPQPVKELVIGGKAVVCCRFLVEGQLCQQLEELSELLKVDQSILSLCVFVCVCVCACQQSTIGNHGNKTTNKQIK